MSSALGLNLAPAPAPATANSTTTPTFRLAHEMLSENENSRSAETKDLNSANHLMDGGENLSNESQEKDTNSKHDQNIGSTECESEDELFHQHSSVGDYDEEKEEEDVLRENDDDDEDQSKSGTPDLVNESSRKNKRKNFKPRNIHHDENWEESVVEENESSSKRIKNNDCLVEDEANDEDTEQKTIPLNLSGDASLSNQRKSLLPRRRLDLEKESQGCINGSTPMDLSVTPTSNNSEQESSVKEQQQPSLSVVRPEVLFGNNEKVSDSENSVDGVEKGTDNHQDILSKLPGTLANLPFSPFLAAAAAAAAAASSANGEDPNKSLFNRGGTETMKEAFQEVLKIYGFPKDLAETIAKNAQNAQDKFQLNNNNNINDSPPTTSSSSSVNPIETSKSPSLSSNQPPTFPNFHPGMLSAVLMGNSCTSPQSNTNTHPPTPPRTPKTPSSSELGLLSRLQQEIKLPTLPVITPPASGLPSSVPGSNTQAHANPLLSLSAIKEQITASKPTSTGPNILASHLNKPMIMPGMIPGMPMPPHMSPAGIPPHILAAQRAGMLPGSSKTPTDYTRYFKRFGSSLECGSLYCKDMNYREHFHCTVPMCKDKVFAKKEEMIRHSKWHQKMDEAFKYGFRRVTPMDDCSDQFPDCQHNKKQTHYHCIHTAGCDKCYISTSDVQMHFNYHRKDNAIQREGFLRFRGCEDCGTTYCPYRNQKTTHFHCNRTGCQFIFKNKADMEKHKNYHMKDEQLNKDGFKKFMKHDNCGFPSCRFSKSVNHIHCIRDNCDYVLHSSGQLYSHKRKHERKDNEIAYRKYKLTQGMLNGNGDLLNPDERPPSSENGSLTSESSSTPPLFKQEQVNPTPPAGPFSLANLLQPQKNNSPITPPFGLPFGLQSMVNSGMVPNPVPPTGSGIFNKQCPVVISDMMKERMPDDIWREYMLHFDSGEGCGFQGCEIEEVEHFHCKEDGCESVFRNDEGVREHGRNHFIQEQITEAFFQKSDPEDKIDDSDETNVEDEEYCTESCPHKKTKLHFHCKWENCGEVIFNTDSPFKRLDHYKLHEYTRKWNNSANPINNSSTTNNSNKEQISMTMGTSIDAMFKRKRGRPPKNRVVEVWNDNLPGTSGSAGSFNELGHGSPQAVFTSFKLPKPGISAASLPTNPISLLDSFQNLESSKDVLSSTAKLNKLTAPLGGLPEIQTQLNKSLSRSEEENQDKVDSDGGNNSSDELSPAKNQGMVKARGTYYPLTAFPTDMPQGPVMRKEASPVRKEGSSSSDDTSPTISLKSKLGVNFLVSCARQGDSENALAKLLQVSQDMVSSSNSIQSSSPPLSNIGSSEKTKFVSDIKGPLVSSPPPSLPITGMLDARRRGSLSAHPVFGPEPQEESCGRPFCKLKRRAHYHCNFCNQGFTEKEKLEPHLKRHTAGIAANQPQQQETMPVNLESLLREGISRDSVHAESLRSRLSSSDSIPPLTSQSPSSSELPLSLVTSPTTTQAVKPLEASSPPTTSSSSSPADSSVLGLTPTSPFLAAGFPSPFVGFGRNPFPANSQSGMLLPPGMNPFLPPGILLPGLGNPFQRTTTAPTFDPSKHPLTRMPDSSVLKRSSPLNFFDNDSPSSEKKVRLQTSMRMLKDEPVPEGYMRFRFNEDCGFTCCNYREHQTHFHCMRKDCNYRFCDKTRFVQHTARHERLDTLCGAEFEGFRGVECGRDSCELNINNNRASLPGEPAKSSSHFHCLKCDYYCTDTNKVVAHRRQHQKLDSIIAAGFEKYTPAQNCGVSNCSHGGKQTHYHCNKCQYAVLGLSQMEAHKYRHMNE